MIIHDQTIIKNSSKFGNERFVTPIRTIAVAGGKGGVGKTNIAINLAVALADIGNRVLLLDADFGLANVDVLLNLKNVQRNIQHVLKQSSALADIIIEGPRGIKVIPASSGIQKMTGLCQHEYLGIVQAFDDLELDIDTLIIDTAAGISDDVIFFSKAAQEIMVVVCNEPTSITDAYAFIKVMNKEHQVVKFQVVANMVKNFNEASELFCKLNKAANRFLDITLCFNGGIPHDDLLKKAVQQQRSVVDAYPHSRSALAFKQLSKKVNMWPTSYEMSDIRFFMQKIMSNSCAEGTLS